MLKSIWSLPKGAMGFTHTHQDQDSTNLFKTTWSAGIPVDKLHHSGNKDTTQDNILCQLEEPLKIFICELGTIYWRGRPAQHVQVIVDFIKLNEYIMDSFLISKVKLHDAATINAISEVQQQHSHLPNFSSPGYSPDNWSLHPTKGPWTRQAVQRWSSYPSIVSWTRQMESTSIK